MSDAPKSFHLTPEIHAYLVAHGSPPDALQNELIEATRSLGGVAVMQIAPEQGALMELLCRLIGARRAIEIGTFTGYSALCIARALPADGRLVCCDISEEWAAVGRPFWRRAGVEARIDLRIAPARETLAHLASEAPFDFAFIDADKSGYESYYEGLLSCVRPGGLILVDNVLWSGRVVNPEARDADTLAIRAFNERVSQDPRVDCVMLPVSDGLTLLRVRER